MVSTSPRVLYIAQLICRSGTNEIRWNLKDVLMYVEDTSMHNSNKKLSMFTGFISKWHVMFYFVSSINQQQREISYGNKSYVHLKHVPVSST